MNEELARLRKTFKTEAIELLESLERHLLELERAPADKELIAGVFRCLHTIKGSSSMVGFEGISGFAHKLEAAFERVRRDELPITGELIDVILRSSDHIRELLTATDAEKRAHESAQREIVAALDAIVSSAPSSATDKPFPSGPPGPGKPVGVPALYRIRFSPGPAVFLRGLDPLLILDDLRQLGECTAIALTGSIPVLEAIDPEACYTAWDIVLTTDRGIDAVRDVFIFVEGDSEVRIDVLADSTDGWEHSGHKRLGEILVERDDVTIEEVSEVLSRKKRIGEMLVEEGLVTIQQVQSALTEQQIVHDTLQRYHQAEAASTIRVSSRKLDQLVDLVGEMVTVQARLTESAALTCNPAIVVLSEELTRLTEQLREHSMQMRLVPVGTMFSKFRRLVRDLSQKLGKDVELSTHGGDTELDKTIIEKLHDPLVHLIRNCIDHGIEFPVERESTGKTPKGYITLTAAHSGSYVVVEVKDDGSGLDGGAIFSKAVEKGLVAEDALLTEEDCHSLIFAPGFSTASTVTDVSGRGVGLDVVKRSIEALRGSIEIKSVRGKGTSILLKLPLTLAIIEGLLVQVGHEYFVIPVTLVEECVELTREYSPRARRRHIVSVRGEIVPYFSLREYFSINGDSPQTEQVIITRSGGERVGIVVDAVIGQHQTVIKTLGRVFRDAEGISGATILGNGTVALILDVPKLLKVAEHAEVSRV